MEARNYKVSKAEHSSGDVAYRLDGPGVKAGRVYCGEETRERLEDVVELMNFAFEQGRQALTAELRAASRLGTSLVRGESMVYGCRMKHPDPVKAFGIVLPAVAEMMDEQKLSKGEAMAALRGFLEGDAQPTAVKEAIARLEASEDEAELRAMLGKESVRALSLKDSCR